MCGDSDSVCKAEVCGICLESMKEIDIGELLPCKHRYHISCIRQWHLYSNDFHCPTCRKDSKHLHRIYEDIKIDLQYWCNVSLVEQFTKLRLLNEDCENNSSGEGDAASTAAVELDSAEREEIQDEPKSGSPELVLVQCALCGDMDDNVSLYCETCETLFHPSCLTELLCEVGETDWLCTECHGNLSHLRGRGPSSMIVRDSNVRIYEGRMRDKRSILTECIYNRFAQPYTLSYDDKCKIQQFVRSELDSYYQQGSLTKDRYITINKIVSRKLYEMSPSGFDPVRLDYKELAKLSIKAVI